MRQRRRHQQGAAEGRTREEFRSRDHHKIAAREILRQPAPAEPHLAGVHHNADIVRPGLRQRRDTIFTGRSPAQLGGIHDLQQDFFTSAHRRRHRPAHLRVHLFAGPQMSLAVAKTNHLGAHIRGKFRHRHALAHRHAARRAVAEMLAPRGMDGAAAGLVCPHDNRRQGRAQQGLHQEQGLKLGIRARGRKHDLDVGQPQLAAKIAARHLDRFFKSLQVRLNREGGPQAHAGIIRPRISMLGNGTRRRRRKVNHVRAGKRRTAIAVATGGSGQVQPGIAAADEQDFQPLPDQRQAKGFAAAPWRSIRESGLFAKSHLAVAAQWR